MARKKESTYQNWDEVNSAMKHLAELNIRKKALENEQNIRIDEVKKEISLQSEGLIKDIAFVTKEITRFAEQHRDEFTQKRTKVLTFGRISFRYTSWVWVEDAKAAIKSLKTFAMDKYLRVKEELDKDALLEADPKLLAKCGIQLRSGDKITIEPDYVKLAAIDTEDIPF